jgi:hypothetical protein
METATTGQAAIGHEELRTTKMDYVRMLLRQKQPAFSAALELAVNLVELPRTASRNSCH